MSMKVLVGAEPIAAPDRERMVARFPQVAFSFAEDAAAMVAGAPEAEAIFAKGIPREALAGARALRWVQAGTAGVDGLLRLGLRERPDVVLTNARGAHGVPMAENVLTMALCFATRMHLLLRGQRERARLGPRVIREKWELHGQTLAVLGLGDVGGTLAEKGAALGMRVLGVRRTGTPHPHCATVTSLAALATVLPEADHVAVCLPLTPETRGVIGERELRLMRPTAHLYNVGRGACVDGVALRRALAEGWIAGAGLDCVEPSDRPADDDPLWEMENVILSLHTSGSSPDNSRRITDIFMENLERYRRGEPLRNVVDPGVGY
jgi:phosphoglycerate dehydrogenase-like enzyme